MKWLVQFYNERRAILARYGVEARLPADAVRLGWKAVLAEHPTPRRHGRLGLFERAQRVEGQDASGWILYRIRREGGQTRAESVVEHDVEQRAVDLEPAVVLDEAQLAKLVHEEADA